MKQPISSAADPQDYSGLCVLIVEDDEIIRLSLEDRLRLEGIPVRSAQDVAEASQQLQKGDVDLVISDIRLPDGSGADLFDDISQHYPGTPVILMTAYGEITDAVNLVKAGAADYLTKPFKMDDFVEKIHRHLSRLNDTYLSAGFLRSDDESFRPGSGVLGRSSSMRRIERLVGRLSDADSSVLISGESGVGKEVVATLIHHNSPRVSGPLITVNCAALPPNLIESELFGHEKGAFTGATNRRIGRFEQAQKGTIFLDEIAEIPTEIQVKLLRVIQEREIERVGGEKSIPLDVRIIAATQVDLDEAVKVGTFRTDLYWRLNVIRIHIPSLRDRQEDVLYLSRLFVEEQALKFGVPVNGLSADAEARLMSMTFPGNVRELKNILERAVVLCDGPRVTEHDLLPLDDDLMDDAAKHNTLKESIASAERQAIFHALVESGWVIGEAAQLLGISRKNLWEKMKRYGIEKEN
ncbi:MAG: sigma-54-dependent Fis family transcriptional regulator [Rhodospirillaceae bacterium]|jgi:DNA-binding NtrC family response regulator|nr:sigma-54-dependent Fis family transcriptional regulator [Rhodospirillaceae bacterium]MBT7356293.1 sigma-54-dependent Fis family transcriptional regulator [Rhodospirillaceae bacterium]